MRRIRTWGVVLGAILAMVMLSTPSPWPGGGATTIAGQGEDMAGMGMATPSAAPIAELLTGMMGSPVILVPQLADVPGSALGNVYVFANGVRPEGAMGGPLGFQPDVFDSAPGDAAYSPLRAVNLVTWAENAEPRVLRSAEEVRSAEAAGELATEQPGVDVNMPFLTWPAGHR